MEEQSSASSFSCPILSTPLCPQIPITSQHMALRLSDNQHQLSNMQPLFLDTPQTSLQHMCNAQCWSLVLALIMFRIGPQVKTITVNFKCCFNIASSRLLQWCLCICNRSVLGLPKKTEIIDNESAVFRVHLSSKHNQNHLVSDQTGLPMSFKGPFLVLIRHLKCHF